MRMILLLVFVGAGPLGELRQQAQDPVKAPVSSLVTVSIQGQVVCLPEAMHAAHGTELPVNHPHLYGFRTVDQVYYTLLRTKFSEAIFMDEQLHQKTLLLKARIFPRSHVAEVLNIRSVKNGIVQDLFYYCDICAIESISPEICACCRGPVELIERPLEPGP